MAKKPEFKEFADSVLECLKKHGISPKDLYVYPVTEGYRVEVYGELNGNVLNIIHDCVSELTGFKVVLARVERGYIKLLVKKLKAN